MAGDHSKQGYENMKNKHVDDITDTLDAAVFTGDFLTDEEDRAEFAALLERWGREVQVHDDAAAQ